MSGKILALVRGLGGGLRKLPRAITSGSGAALDALTDRCRRPRAFLYLLAVVLATLGISSCTTSCTPTNLNNPNQTFPGTPVPTVRVKLGQPMHAVQLSATTSFRLLADGRLVQSRDGGFTTAALTYTGGHWVISGGGLPSAISANSLSIELTGKGLVGLAPCNWSGTPTTPMVYYRGDMRLLAQDTESFIAVNRVDMEGYIAGVLPKELYSSWHYETYRALAIAARTFAEYQRTHPKTAGQPFDLGDNESSQMYGGYSAEHSSPDNKAFRAVASTRGKVLVYRGDMFLAQYSSCCGGRVNPASVLRADAPDIPPLRGGQVCTDCMGSSKFNWSPVTIRKSELLAALRERYDRARGITGISAIQVTAATPSGRAVMVDVVGPGGSVRLRADDLRLAWNMYNNKNGGGKNLPSINCQWQINSDSVTFYNGHGYGHGVGLCQFGAEGKALRGLTGEQILGAYYPDASVKTAW